MNKRDYLIEDIINWKIELEEVGGGGEYTDKNIENLVQELEKLSETQLLDRWRHSVGEWIASRSDVNREWDKFCEEKPSKASEYDNLVEWQLEKLVNGKDTDYGYIKTYNYKK